MGAVVAPDGVVVYGTGYSYQPWIGTAWYPPPAIYGVAAQPVYNPAAGMAFGFAMGVTTAALVGSSSSYYHPSYYGYPCCASTRAAIPVYKYYCDNCRRDVSITLSISEYDKAKAVCPACGNTALLVSTFFFQTSRKS
jgi:putative FmdB family regulatory protein